MSISVPRTRDGAGGEALYVSRCMNRPKMGQKLTTNYILRRLRDLRMTAFEAAELSRVLGLDPARGYKVLGRLVASGHVERVGRGTYAVADPSGGPPRGPVFLRGPPL